MAIFLFDEQPLVFFISPLGMHQSKSALYLFSEEFNFQIAFFQLLYWVGSYFTFQNLISAFIPNFHFPGAIISLGNGSVKRAVFNGMVLRHNRQSLILRIHRPTFGSCPTFENALHFQTEVVMQSAGLVALYYTTTCIVFIQLALWFGCFVELALFYVIVQRHD